MYSPERQVRFSTQSRQGRSGDRWQVLAHSGSLAASDFRSHRICAPQLFESGRRAFSAALIGPHSLMQACILLHLRSHKRCRQRIDAAGGHWLKRRHARSLAHDARADWRTSRGLRRLCRRLRDHHDRNSLGLPSGGTCRQQGCYRGQSNASHGSLTGKPLRSRRWMGEKGSGWCLFPPGARAFQAETTRNRAMAPRQIHFPPSIRTASASSVRRS